MTNKSKTKSTSEVKVPEWVSQGGQQLFNSADKWNKENPVTGYTGDRSAPASANQQAASTMAAATANAGQADIEAARNLTRQGAQGTYQPVIAQQWNNEQATKYMSPFATQVRDNTLREIDRGNTIQQRGVDDRAQAAKAFGGDRHAILMGEVMRDQGQQRTDYIDRANEAAYADAANRFNADRSATMNADQFNEGNRQQGFDRLIRAGGQMGDLGNTSAGMASRGVQGLLTTGMVDQDVNQRALDADYQEFLRVQNGGMDRYGQLAGILSGVPINRTENSTSQTKSGSLGSSLLGIAQIGASMYSDRRLKREIRKIGDLAKGVGIYAYKYIWPSVEQIGVMADEVLASFPQAVEQGPRGYHKVNYGKLMEMAVA
jgi:hypothetical protein